MPRFWASGLPCVQYTQPLNWEIGTGKYCCSALSTSVPVPPDWGTEMARSLMRSLSSRIRLIAVWAMRSQGRIPGGLRHDSFGLPQWLGPGGSLGPQDFSAYLARLSHERLHPGHRVRREHDLDLGALHHRHEISSIFDDCVALQELDLTPGQGGKCDVSSRCHVGIGDGLWEGYHPPTHSRSGMRAGAGTRVRKPLRDAVLTASSQRTVGGWLTHGQRVWSTLVSSVCSPIPCP